MAVLFFRHKRVPQKERRVSDTLHL